MARNLQWQCLYGVEANMPALYTGEFYYAIDTHSLYVGPVPTKVGGNSSGLNLVQAEVDFGSDTGPITRTFDATVQVSATWVTDASVIVCSLSGATTDQHGPEDGLVEGIVAQAENLVPGMGFTLHAYSPLGSWGKYAFNCVGA